MIITIEKNLQRGIKLLNTLTDAQYSNATIPPYFSSIGCHMRHVLDAFTSIFDGLETKNIDFSNRQRNTLAEQETAVGIAYFNETIQKLHALNPADFDMLIAVTDDLGTGKITVNHTLGSVLAQAQSHAIHHYASVGFIINQLGIALPEADFGYNPTTPKKELKN